MRMARVGWLQYGLRTAEKRAVPGNHYRQKYPYSCYAHDCCFWGGPVWPFETAKALTGAANVLQNPKLAGVIEGNPSGLTRATLWMMLSNYTAMHGDQWMVSNFTDGTRANYQELNNSGFFLRFSSTHTCTHNHPHPHILSVFRSHSLF